MVWSSYYEQVSHENLCIKFYELKSLSTPNQIESDHTDRNIYVSSQYYCLFLDHVLYNTLLCGKLIWVFSVFWFNASQYCAIQLKKYIIETMLYNTKFKSSYILNWRQCNISVKKNYVVLHVLLLYCVIV